MIASVYSELIQYEEVGGDLVHRLSSINKVDVFQPAIDYYKDDHSKLNKCLFFILHTYSIGSKYHIIGQDWLEIKEGIADKVGILIGTDLYNETVLLESKEVVNAIQNYIDYQGNRNFKHLIMLKELYEQMFSSALNAIKKAGGVEVDYDQKNKNKDYATKLLEEIGVMEQKVADSIGSHLKEGMQEINKKGSNKQMSLKLEDNIT